MIRAELGGERVPELVVQNTRLEIKAGWYKVSFAGETTDAGTVELGRDSEKKTLTLRGTAGLNAERTIPCTYQVAGARMRICYGINGISAHEPSSSLGVVQYAATYRRSNIA
jgi:uncharacterized protein (TIGR03067 family)